MSPASTVARRPSAGPRPRPSGRRRRRRRASGLRGLTPPRWWPAALLLLAVVVGVAWKGVPDGDEPAETACVLPASGVELTTEQIGNARTIAQVGRDRGLPERAVVIALATAMQESSLRNLDHGDRDSLGLFQQRPSQGWGTPEQVQDPLYAAGIFYDRLLEVPGWDTARLTESAQRVQRSGFPEAYQQHEAMAVELATTLDAGESPCP
ncbi:hypothetical protein [Blastococcus sp. TF02A-26]|uniref:hypothetical protein n=1 Tax=Blastococcus sp. TF02A-26 TaxID=2250577 RepID=UPI0018F739DE|nr:hypothetical protein [Blastococcus sp. TF02A-26]